MTELVPLFFLKKSVTVAGFILKATTFLPVAWKKLKTNP
jgi:hypothetical protein